MAHQLKDNFKLTKAYRLKLTNMFANEISFYQSTRTGSQYVLVDGGIEKVVMMVGAWGLSVAPFTKAVDLLDTKSFRKL